jgi:uncharacterized repeat protein (TIGR01451 family)
MSAMKLLRLLLVGMMTAVVALPQSAVAQAPAAKTLVITAHNVTAAAAASGRKNATLARPGDVIRYTLVFTNVTAGAVKNIRFVDPLPKGLVYVLGSAKADHPVQLEYSIDGGKSYVAQPMIEVVENGKKVEKAAARELYTHVRWTVLGALAPGAKVIAELRAQVTAAPGEAK